MEDTIYDHYIAIDWADMNMAIARMTKKSNKITAVDVPSDIDDVKAYLKNLKGTKILAIEETTTSQWLYTELKEFVDKIFICDPHRNRLLSEGPKTDKIDATKLVQLLKAGLMKEVYHSTDRFLYLRRVVSGYEDLIKAGVRIKNQRSSLLSYTGLMKLDKVSGGRSYGKKNPRYCRQLKSVYKTGVMAAIGGNNPINDYYEHLIQEKGYSEYNARHKACRRLAILSLGVFKSGKKYQPYRRSNLKESQEAISGL